MSWPVGMRVAGDSTWPIFGSKMSLLRLILRTNLRYVKKSLQTHNPLNGLSVMRNIPHGGMQRLVTSDDRCRSTLTRRLRLIFGKKDTPMGYP